MELLNAFEQRIKRAVFHDFLERRFRVAQWTHVPAIQTFLDAVAAKVVATLGNAAVSHLTQAYRAEEMFDQVGQGNLGRKLRLHQRGLEALRHASGGEKFWIFLEIMAGLP